MKRRDGRPSALQLDPGLEHLLCALAAQGVPLTHASRALGLGSRSVFRWLYQGRHGNDRYARFADGIAAAECERQHHVELLLAAAQRQRVARTPERLRR